MIALLLGVVQWSQKHTSDFLKNDYGAYYEVLVAKWRLFMVVIDTLWSNGSEKHSFKMKWCSGSQKHTKQNSILMNFGGS